MDWKTILVQLSNPRRTSAMLSVASRIAERFNSHLIGLNVANALAHMPSTPMLLGPQDLAAFRSMTDEEAARLKADFEEATRGRAFVAEWRNVEADGFDAPSTAIGHTHAADLIVASQADPEWELSGMFDAPERLALESGRPVLVVPYAGTYGEIGKRVVIAWSNKRESARAVFDAMPLLKGAESVTLLCVATRGAHGEPEEIPGTEIASALARHGVKVAIQKSVAEEISVADDILSRSADLGADLLVMGAYGHSRLREMVFGGVTRNIMKHMTTPTLLSH